VDAELAADEVLRKTGSPRLGNGIAVDVERIIRQRHDVDVARVPNVVLEGQILAGLFAPEYHVVIVEANDIAARQRFTLGHELGHIELHYKSRSMQPLFQTDPGTMSYRCTALDLSGDVADGRRRAREVVANRFAAAILMPRGLVQEIWSKRRDEARCASDLKVSRQALRIRLEEVIGGR
jgi:Zn-dependent peptidase ImmA (M78 family)